MISCFTVSSVRRYNSSKLMNREGDIAADGSPGWRWFKPGRSLSSPGGGLRSSVLVWSCEADVGGPKDKKQYQAAIYYIFAWALLIIDKSIKKIHSGCCPILIFLHILWGRNFLTVNDDTCNSKCFSKRLCVVQINTFWFRMGIFSWQ